MDIHIKNTQKIVTSFVSAITIVIRKIRSRLDIVLYDMSSVLQWICATIQKIFLLNH